MHDRINIEALKALKDRVKALKDVDYGYGNTTPEDDLESLYELGELLKNAVKNPDNLPLVENQALLNDYWHELARLLISNNFYSTLVDHTTSKGEDIRHWLLFFSDSRWTPVIKDNLVSALIRSNALMSDLKKKGSEANGFFMAMRVQKHRSALANLKPHLSDTHHGALVAWLIQLKDELPKEDPRFIVGFITKITDPTTQEVTTEIKTNPVHLTNDSDDAEIKQFLDFYLTPQQPPRPDLFALIAALSQEKLSFSTQARAIRAFKASIETQYHDKDDRAKIYNKLLSDFQDLGKNKPNHRASLIIYKHTFPLLTYVLSNLTEAEYNLKNRPIDLSWYSHTENKKRFLDSIANHLDVFAPELTTAPKKALEIIIDHQKAGLFSSTSHSRQALNALLHHYEEKGEEIHPIKHPQS